ncbi:MAG: lysophospholipid acyltransferase family protein [Acidimicrobiia bacterium]
MTRFQYAFYGVCRALLSGAIRVLWRVRISGADRLPAQGAYVLAPSHRSMFDIFVLACPTRRRLRFMGKRELFEIPVLGAVFSALGGFPVDREAADRAALRSALAMLERGEPVVMYPEGTRGHGPVLGEMHDGASYLAARAGVPIVPVGIGGTEEILPTGKVFPRFHRIAVVVGEPIAPPSRRAAVKRANVTDLTRRVRVVLQEAFDESLARAGVETAA